MMMLMLMIDFENRIIDRIDIVIIRGVNMVKNVNVWLIISLIEILLSRLLILNSVSSMMMVDVLIFGMCFSVRWM